MKTGILTALLAMAFGVAQAGEYHCARHYDDEIPCTQLIGDLVTNQFTQRFPSDRFEIVLIAAIGSYQDGSASGFATAGVAPIGQKMLPASIETRYFQLDAPLSARQLSEAEQDYLRRAMAISFKKLGYLSPSANMLLDNSVYTEEIRAMPVQQKQCQAISVPTGFYDANGNPLLKPGEICR